MMARCYNPKASGYPRYGARGIAVCERWHDVNAFIADMSPRPPGGTLDRINNDGPYSLENVRWASMTTQSRNRRSNKLTEAKVAQLRQLYREGHRLTDLAKRFGISDPAVHAIVNGVTWR